MFQSLIKNSAVQLFGLAAKLGVQRLPMFERVFLVLYAGYKRHFEAGPIERLQEFIPDGSLVIDVGANVGFFSLRFARWVGSGGEVIAIEPEDRNYQTLIAALKREGLSGTVRAMKAVAAATAGPMFLEINHLHPADHKLSRDGTGVAVEAVRLDDLVQDKGVRKPSLVKIDVQGAEMLGEGRRERLRRRSVSQSGLIELGQSLCFTRRLGWLKSEIFEVAYCSSLDGILLTDSRRRKRGEY